MSIEFIINQIRKISFRPIPRESLITINEYIGKECKDEEKKNLYNSILQMGLQEFKKLVIRSFFAVGEECDLFLLSCICSRIGYIESKSIIPNAQVSNLKWQKYLDITNDSSVDQYSINNDFLAVLFKTSSKIYVYSYSKTGLLGTEYMKTCAVKGDGLGSCTAKYFRDHQGFTTVN